MHSEAGSQGYRPQAGDPQGCEPQEHNPLGHDPLGHDPAGYDPLGRDPLGHDPLGRDPLGRDPLGHEPQAGDPQAYRSHGGRLQGGDTLSWLHIGDLHITGRNEQNLLDLRRIVTLINALPSDSLDFVLLPGDNADDGSQEQFELVRDATASLRLPLHILAGDHDFKPRNLEAFHRVLGARKLPYAETVRGHRCLFLDVVSAGTGGADFRLSGTQLDWVEQELAQSDRAVVFMHSYPADLREGAERLCALLAGPQVRCVDMGHTHYNELANDSRTIFMATRSTGQTEEGPPGFSIAAIDGDCVSWRFKTLEQAWPFVLVIQPADHRLARTPNRTVQGTLVVRAKVLGDLPIETVEVSVDNGDWMPMSPASGEATLWQATVGAPARSIRVRARDASGLCDQDEVEPAKPDWAPSHRTPNGSDRNRIGAWPAKGILDTQLGPNRNGRAW